MLRHLLVLLGLAVLATAVARGAEADRFFDQGLGDFQAELAAAKESGKRGLLLMFETEGCPYCRKMRETILNQPQVQTYFRRHFSIFSVDMLGDVEIQDVAGRSMSEKAYARELGVRATPTFIFIGTEGRVLASHAGASRDAREFMQLGHYVAEGFHKTLSFAEYRRTQH